MSCSHVMVLSLAACSADATDKPGDTGSVHTADTGGCDEDDPAATGEIAISVALDTADSIGAAAYEVIVDVKLDIDHRDTPTDDCTYDSDYEHLEYRTISFGWLGSFSVPVGWTCAAAHGRGVDPSDRSYEFVCPGYSSPTFITACSRVDMPIVAECTRELDTSEEG